MCLTNWLPFPRDGSPPPHGYLELLSLHDLIFGVIGKKWYLVMRGGRWERERDCLTMNLGFGGGDGMYLMPCFQSTWS